jgi:hypothetical protein
VVLFLFAGGGFTGAAVASGGLHGFFPFQPPALYARLYGLAFYQ